LTQVASVLAVAGTMGARPVTTQHAAAPMRREPLDVSAVRSEHADDDAAFEAEVEAVDPDFWVPMPPVAEYVFPAHIVAIELAEPAPPPDDF